MWFWFQLLILYVVICTNIHWQWTDSARIAGWSGALVAWSITLLLRWLLDRRRRAAPRRLSYYPKPNQQAGRVGTPLRSRQSLEDWP